MEDNRPGRTFPFSEKRHMPAGAHRLVVIPDTGDDHEAIRYRGMVVTFDAEGDPGVDVAMDCFF